MKSDKVLYCIKKTTFWNCRENLKTRAHCLQRQHCASRDLMQVLHNGMHVCLKAKKQTAPSLPNNNPRDAISFSVYSRTYSVCACTVTAYAFRTLAPKHDLNQWLCKRLSRSSCQHSRTSPLFMVNQVFVWTKHHIQDPVCCSRWQWGINRIGTTWLDCGDL